MKRITKSNNGHGYQFLYLFPVHGIDGVGEWKGDVDRGIAWAEDLHTAQIVHDAANSGAILFEYLPAAEDLRDIDWYDGGSGLINALEALREINAPVWCFAIRPSCVRFDFNGISAPAAYILGALGRFDNQVLKEGQRGVVIHFD